VTAIEAANAVIGLLSHRREREAIEITAEEMPQRVTTERVTAEQHDIHDENDGAEPDAEVLMARIAIEEPHRFVSVASEDDQENERRVEEVAVDVLDHQRQESLTSIALARLANAAIRRIRPEALVVRAPIV